MLQRSCVLVCLMVHAGGVPPASAQHDSHDRPPVFENPGDTAPSGQRCRISGRFPKTFYGLKADRVVITVTKVGQVNPIFSDNTCMTDHGAPPKTKVKFDTDVLGVIKQPIIGEAGAYVITVTAERKDNNGVFIPIETGSKTITA
jgi:hypothetical protein